NERDPRIYALRGATVAFGTPNAAGSSPDNSMFGSTCIGGLAISPTFVGNIVIDKTSGAMLRGRNETLTSFSIVPAPDLSNARHCMNLAFGLAI
ncbi:hypothetical protein, partial [Ralstonia solanacearum species complex bacterium KE055]|uniref:hypothetical protein n=1 Tax=Ralstonia solanacearum species complex bacterium KE055 TaxID=3119586 RepID=UPI002FC3763E